jgi:membrane-bound serine protease (ClpP class)
MTAPARHLTASDTPGFHRGESEAPPAAVGTLLEVLAVPEVAFLLVSAGLLCAVLRFAQHALEWPFLAGGFTLLVGGSAGLLMLPVAAAGLLMLGFAAVSLWMEVASPGFGLHALGGAISLAFAGIYLTVDPPGAHPVLVVPAAAAVGAATYLAGRRSWRWVRDRPLEPSTQLVDRGTVVLAAEGSTGQGVVAGQVWNLRVAEGTLMAGQTVRVVGVASSWLMVVDAPDVEVL